MAKNDGNKLVNAAHHRCQRSLPRRSCYGQEMARHAPWACAAQMLLAVGCLLLLAAPSCGLHCAAPSSLAPAPSDATPSQPLSYHHRVWAANRLRGGSGAHELPPLPEGWEERVHTDGRVYYLNHMQKTTQWDRPMPAAPAPGFVVDHGARVASAMPSSGAGLMDGGQTPFTGDIPGPPPTKSRPASSNSGRRGGTCGIQYRLWLSNSIGTSLGSVSLSLVAPMAASFEQVVKPRMGFVVNVLGRLPTSLVLFLLSVPFGGQLKAMAMVVMGLGMLSRDGLLYLGAWAFVMFTFGVVKFLALTAIVGLATVYSPNR